MSEHLPSATDQLDAIVGSTEEATNGILQAMESLEALVGEMSPELGEKVTDAVTQVYESCNFQDITGQRITKVVKALKHIEAKVDALVGAFGDDIAKYKSTLPAGEPAAKEAAGQADGGCRIAQRAAASGQRLQSRTTSMPCSPASTEARRFDDRCPGRKPPRASDSGCRATRPTHAERVAAIRQALPQWAQMASGALRRRRRAIPACRPWSASSS